MPIGLTNWWDQPKIVKVPEVYFEDYLDTYLLYIHKSTPMLYQSYATSASF